MNSLPPPVTVDTLTDAPAGPCQGRGKDQGAGRPTLAVTAFT